MTSIRFQCNQQSPGVSINLSARTDINCMYFILRISPSQGTSLSIRTKFNWHVKLSFVSLQSPLSMHSFLNIEIEHRRAPCSSVLERPRLVQKPSVIFLDEVRTERSVLVLKLTSVIMHAAPKTEASKAFHRRTRPVAHIKKAPLCIPSFRFSSLIVLYHSHSHSHTVGSNSSQKYKHIDLRVLEVGNDSSSQSLGPHPRLVHCYDYSLSHKSFAYGQRIERFLPQQCGPF